MKRILTRTFGVIQSLVCLQFAVVTIICLIAMSFVYNGFNREEWAKDWQNFKRRIRCVAKDYD